MVFTELYFSVFSIVGQFWFLDDALLLAFSFHLLDVIILSVLLVDVLSALTKNGKRLVITIVLAVILVHLYGVVGFIYFRQAFDPEAVCAAIIPQTLN